MLCYDTYVLGNLTCTYVFTDVGLVSFEPEAKATKWRPSADWRRRLDDHFSGKSKLTDFDMAGTAFQKTVWRAIADIPRGETRTYTELAQIVGKPKAARAVASACAQNPLLFVIPCHRVVAKHGLGGYKYGTALKQQLLEQELC
ncbi:MAG: hypothetical protein A2Y14_04265 [Verrucomicrobia bacterium GWF2_51_19]|nr:MAG: hypothetical protein A2Y14_04265 [Verrucomicrobia bacterium GWF2_51_19]HCJ12233.1 hypothetical protein [Opitutae bacterium]